MPLALLPIGFRPKETVLLYRQIGALIGSGASLPEALEALSEEAGRTTGKMLGAVRADMQRGVSIADSLGRHPRFFSPAIVELVKVNPDSALLARLFNTVADEEQRREILRQRIRGSLLYPLLVLLMAFLVANVISIYVLPVFMGLFTEAAGALPPLTMMVHKIASLVRDWFYLICLAILLIVLVLTRFSRLLHAIGASLPPFRSIAKAAATIEFSRYMAMFLLSNMPVRDCVYYSAGMVYNMSISRELKRMASEITDIRQLKEVMKLTHIFPGVVLQMVATGIKTGSTEQALSQVANYYEADINVSIHRVQVIFDFVVIISIGTLIGLMVIGCYLPIFQLADVVSR